MKKTLTVVVNESWMLARTATLPRSSPTLGLNTNENCTTGTGVMSRSTFGYISTTFCGFLPYCFWTTTGMGWGLGCLTSVCLGIVLKVAGEAITFSSE